MKKKKIRIPIDGLKELVRENGNRELVASKMKRTTRTVDRWADLTSSPSPAECEKLRRIITGMRSAAERKRQLAGVE